MKRLLFAFAAIALLATPEVRANTPAACGAVPSPEFVKGLLRQAPGLRENVLRLALDASGCAAQKGLVKRRELLTVIDYSLPSDQKRLFVFNVATGKLLYRELVAHGKNSGGNLTRYFSNSHGSLATSMGLFVTAGTYVGGNGYSLRLRGLEQGVNDSAWDRLIVLHGASYVNMAIIRTMGRLGRSWGCPAVRKEIARPLIDTIKGGSPVFSYYPDREWITRSAYLSNLAKTKLAALQ